jgi:aminoglycoside 2''-phosphotransferase
MMDSIAPELERIRRAFPDLAFERAALIDHGEDHRVIVLDGAWVFRFPREADYLATFPAELSLLATLSARSPLPIPFYHWVAPDRSFGGYRLIEGEALTTARFEGLERKAQEAMTAELAAFLRALHELPHDVLRTADGDPPTDENWHQDQVTDYFARRRPALARMIDDRLLSRLDRAHEIYPTLAPEHRVVIHGDFSPAHILVAPDVYRLAGVIDFGDAALGDPAYDFTVFHGLADWAPALALEVYGDNSEAMLIRSAFSYIRYAVARHGDSEAAPSEATAAIERALRRVGL